MSRNNLFDRKPYMRALIEGPLAILTIVAVCWLVDHVMDADARNLCAASDAASEEVCQQDQ